MPPSILLAVARGLAQDVDILYLAGGAGQMLSRFFSLELFVVPELSIDFGALFDTLGHYGSVCFVWKTTFMMGSKPMVGAGSTVLCK